MDGFFTTIIPILLMSLIYYSFAIILNKDKKLRAKRKLRALIVLWILAVITIPIFFATDYSIVFLLPTILATILTLIKIVNYKKRKSGEDIAFANDGEADEEMDEETGLVESPFVRIKEGTRLKNFYGSGYDPYWLDHLIGGGGLPSYNYSVRVHPIMMELDRFFPDIDNADWFTKKYVLQNASDVKRYTRAYSRTGSMLFINALHEHWKNRDRWHLMLFNDYVCFRITPAEDTTLKISQMEQFWASLQTSHRMSFEIIANSKDGIVFQFLCHKEDRARVVAHLQGFFTHINEAGDADCLLGFVDEDARDLTFLEKYAVMGVQFVLNRHYAMTIRTYRDTNADPLKPLLASLGSYLKTDPSGCMAIQFLIEPSEMTYERHIKELDELPQSFNVNKKLDYPLFAVALKQLYFMRGDMEIEEQRDFKKLFWDISASIYSPFSSGETNGLLYEALPEGLNIPPMFYTYDFILDTEEVAAALTRETYRPGFIFNSMELANLCHFPHKGLTHELLETTEKVVLPEEFKQGGTLVGQFEGKKDVLPCYIPDEWRSSHTYVIGYTGMGKTTLLLNMIKQDIEAGRGVGVIDVKGKDAKAGRYFIDEVLRLVPKGRAKDVVLFDATDLSYPIGFNLIDNKQDMSKNILTQRLFAALERATESTWPDQMQLMFTRALEALLNDPEVHTLLDIELMLYDDAFRYNVLSHLTDAYQRNYWDKIFPETGKATRDGIARRMAEILGDENSRNVLCQPKMAFDFRAVMDTKKIFLAKIPRGNYPITYKFFAKMLMIYFELASMNREQGHPFCLYIDEFQHFADETFQEVINEARSAGIWLTMSHQQTDQIDSKTLGACMSTGTTIVFQVQPQDTRRLEPFFSPNYKETDIMNLGKFHTLTRIGKSQNAFHMATLPIEYPETDYTGQIKTMNRVMYCGEKLQDKPIEPDDFNFVG